MKCALVLEKDPTSSARTSAVLESLGYTTAPVATPDEALNVAHAINFDVIVTCTSIRPNDRRSLTGELKRCAPDAAVVLIADPDERPRAALRRPAGVSAVVERPASFDSLRRVVEFGIDGYGLQPIHVPPARERRSKPA